MKKVLSVLLTLALVLGLCGAFAEEAAEEAVLGAVTQYMVDNNTGILPEEGGVLIPTPVVLRLWISDDQTQATVWGNFWLFAYKLNGKILEMTACGENPGVMKLEKTGDAWSVVSAEFAGEGDAYQGDIERFAEGDEDLIRDYGLSTGATEDSYLPQFQRAAVIAYVEANGLDVEAFQEPGYDPVSITD